MKQPLDLNYRSIDFSRRNFMKKTALTTASIAILSRGTGLANEGDISSKKTKCGLTTCGGEQLVPGGGLGGAPRYYSHVVNGQTKWFTLYTCYCANGHAFGTWKGADSNTVPTGGISSGAWTVNNPNVPVPGSHPTTHTACAAAMP